MKKRLSWFLTGVLVLMVGVCFAQGPLAPPGPPGEIYKTLDQVEPRIPIKSLPITIDTPGSYYLTGNMSYTNPTQNGIRINSSNVTLDLMGYTLTGPGQNTGGAWSAIILKTALSNITIQNGNIEDWHGLAVDCISSSNTLIQNLNIKRIGEQGIYTGYNSQIINCNVANCAKTGIYPGYNSLVKNCHVKECDEGIHGNYYNRIIDCGAYNNATDGIFIRNGSVIQNCTSGNNGGHGIFASGSSGITIIGCSTNANEGNGIGCSAAVIKSPGDDPGSTPPPGAIIIYRNMVNIINCTSEDNTNNGIEAGVGSNITGCAIKTNGGDGINIAETVPLSVGDYYDSYSQIKDCMIYGNTGFGIRIFQYVTVVGNTCCNNANGIYIVSENLILPAPGGSGAAPATIPGKGNRIEANNLMNNTDNGIFVPTNSNSLIIRNWSYGNGDDYDIGAGNTVGPILTGDLSANDNPHANYTFMLL